MNPMTHPLSSADISMFSPEIKKSRNTDIDSILVHNTIPNSFNLSWDFKDCFDKHGYNLDDISKNGYSRPSENQGILKQILWRHNFFVLGAGTKHGHEILYHGGKRFKTRSQKVFGANFYVYISYKGISYKSFRIATLSIYYTGQQLFRR